MIVRVEGVPSYIAIDPGKSTGWATFTAQGTLLACGLAKEPYDTIPRGLSLALIERPWGEGRATQRDLVTLSRRMGEAKAAAGAKEAKEVYPVQWKGSVPKSIRTPAGVFYPAKVMIEGWMSERDRAVFELCTQRVARSAKHNVLDAVGIGLWYARSKGLRK